MEDDAETRGRIEETVRKILEESNLEELTVSQTRMLASEQLGLDLSQPQFKSFVKQVVEAFIQEQNQQIEQQAEDKYDDDGNLIVCNLSEKRRVIIHEFNGKTLVSIREFYRRAGKEFPSSKGISLTLQQWSTFKKNVPAIEEAIKKLESGNI